jgi:PAS domain S-box-containing protein
MERGSWLGDDGRGLDMSTILVVDDRAIGRELVRSLLAQLGHEILEAEDGLRALALALERRPDLIVSDVLMPGMDGYMLVRTLRDHPATAAVRVVFYTAHFTGEEVGPIATACGVDAVVHKTANPRVLVDAVRDALAGSRPPTRVATPEQFAREHVSTFTAKLLEKVRNLEEGDQRFRRMAESSPIGIVQGDAGGCATYVNPRLAEICHRGADQVLGRGWLDCVADGHRAAILGLLRGGTGESGYACHSEVTAADGRRHWFNVGVQLLTDEDGQPAGFIGTVDDVTSIVESQRRLVDERRERAREADQQVTERLASLTRMAGGVAHDFNNMLGVILNYEQFVRDGLTAAAQAGRMDLAAYQETLTDLDRITNAAQRATDLTQQLLAFTGREVTELVRVDLNRAVTQTLDGQRRTLDPRVRVVTRLCPGLPGIVADHSQITQVLLNLTRNAIEAMPDGGVITVETDTVLLPGRAGAAPGPPLPDGSYVRLRVCDTGEGMTPEVAEHAVEPFFTTRAHGHAAGLGLAAVHGIVNQSGGDLSIDSAPGTGTTITVYLPCAATAPPAAVPAPPQRGGTETILVVDDEDGICEATARMLRKAGYRVLTANGGLEALSIAGADPAAIDLLLTDVRMPGLPGVELAGRMLAGNPGLRVLLMSGYAGSFSPECGAPPKTLPIVPKPFTQTELISAVHALLAPAGANP